MNCSAGYVCGVSSPVANQTACGSGRYSMSGWSSCVNCDPGLYSDVTARQTLCSEPCPSGSYCPAGSALPLSCPAGVYGNATMLTTPSCTSSCTPGGYCPTGSSFPIPCPQGTLPVLAGRMLPGCGPSLALSCRIQESLKLLVTSLIYRNCGFFRRRTLRKYIWSQF